MKQMMTYVPLIQHVTESIGALVADLERAVHLTGERLPSSYHTAAAAAAAGD